MSFVSLLLGVVAASAPSWSGPANAQARYPTKTITMICSSAAGGTSDIVSRVLAEVMSESLQQPVIIDNVAGANGTLAAERVARALPDGHTLLSAVDSNLTVNPFLYKINYDPFRDYVPISILTRVRMVLAVGPSGQTRCRS
jgi:tripartite-type tricarboxylate transporter receptor subunit TctC